METDYVEKLILDGTKYVSGSKNDIPEGALYLSASQVGNEPLQNYLKIINGQQDRDEITDATLGTLLHKGMEKIIENTPLPSEVRTFGSEMSLHAQFANGWFITGTADLFVETDDAFEIHDYKFTKYYALKKYKENIQQIGVDPHQYTLQLNTLRWLVEEMGLNNGKPVKMILDFFIRDANKVKKEPVHESVIVPLIIGMEQILLGKTNQLADYIMNAEVPPVCEELWPRKVNGQFIPDIRCQFYCDMKDHCPYYKTKGRHGFDKNLHMAISW